MTDADAHEAIAQHWRTGWDTLHGSGSGDEVTDVAEGEIGASDEEWVRLAVVPTVSQLQTLDAAQRERNALIAVQIFALPASGTRRATELVDDVRTVLEAQVIASGGERVWTLEASAQPGPSDGAWLMRVVTVRAKWYG